MLITLSFNFKTQFFAAVDAYVPLTHLLCVGMILLIYCRLSTNSGFRDCNYGTILGLHQPALNITSLLVKAVSCLE